MLRVHVIACGVLAIDLKAVAKRLGIDASMQFLPGGLHDRPQELRRRLQEAIDQAAAAQSADLIAVGYGVCGLGAVGIHARSIPLAIPRVHDCIALFLGSDTAYKEQFARHPGTYYISAGWVEEKAQPQSVAEGERVSCGPTCYEFKQLIETFGRQNAEDIKRFLSSWQRNYDRAAFVDTGVTDRKQKYADIAAAMAEQFGWKYERIEGTADLLIKLLTARQTTDEVLVVQPHHVTAYDPVHKGLRSVPVWENTGPADNLPHKLVFDDSDDQSSQRDQEAARLGLGIDAGGTYTDAVIYDFERHEVVQKAKALTTKWDFAIGIGHALDQLDAGRLQQVDLVSVSTTLATNAIVEGQGQKAGLLIMPPYGLFDPSDITHRPLAIVDGRMEIDGSEIAPINPDQIRQIVHDMIERQGVAAFAVTGYASHNNPAHELQIKQIIQAESDASVTCGHEVSEGLNYRIRAQTAALNARIISCLETLLGQLHELLPQRGIDAPVMVVRSDGSLMNLATARKRPIETILSGPAASVAGARYLVEAPDVFVVDIGGTTTDTATVRNGVVRTCDEGATVGGWRTHVNALDMRTLGLGGDSLIAWFKRKLHIGPRRVGPICWLAAQHADTSRALDWIEHNIDLFGSSTRYMDLVALNGQTDHLSLSDDEARMVDVLHRRPHSVHELGAAIRSQSVGVAPLQRLEAHHVIQRCGLTPTDLLHVTGAVDLWDGDAAGRLCDLFARLLDTDRQSLARDLIRRVVRKLAVELLKKQLDEETDPDGLESSDTAMALVENLLEGGSDDYQVRVALKRPVIGIGAPASCFLPEAAKLLETEAIIPPHADVANAIGAITSTVVVRRKVRIRPNDAGRFAILGLPEAPTYARFEEAHEYAVAQLRHRAQQMAAEAGTSQMHVEITVQDHIAPLADGGRLFLGRTLEASLIGRPDLVRLSSLT